MTGRGIETGFLWKVKKWNSWPSEMCSKMALEGFNSCAEDVLEKNKLTRLKAATNKDLNLLDTIPILKFAAKIRVGGQNMKRTLKNCEREGGLNQPPGIQAGYAGRLLGGKFERLRLLVRS